MNISKTTISKARLAAVVLAVGVVIAACGSSNDNNGTTSGSTPSPAQSSETQAVVAVGTTSLGSVLVDSQGHTLYLLTADKAGTSTCQAACAGVWPPLTTSGTKPTGGTGVTGTLSTVSTTGSSAQVTIAGHPLYTYSGDSAAGQANGQNIRSFGGVWYAVHPDGTPAISGSSPTPSGSPTTGGGYHY